MTDAGATVVTPPILEARHLRKAFGGNLVLDDVSLAFEPNRLSAIIGPNGAGKTTCFNLLSGFLPPDQGAIRLKGRDVTALAPDRRARLGLCRSFQILNLFDDMSVLENVRVAGPAMRPAAASTSGRPPGPSPRPGTRRPGSSASSASPAASTWRPATCPMASGACSRSAWRWRVSPRCS